MNWRESGIPGIGTLPAGVHLCNFYSNASELFEIQVPFFRQGLQSNEFCLWLVPAPRDITPAQKALKKIFSNVDEFLHSGQLEIVPFHSWYSHTLADPVSIGEIIRHLQTHSRRFQGIRISSNLSWVKNSCMEDFLVFEKALHRQLANTQIICLCMYPAAHRKTVDAIRILSSHAVCVMKTQGEWTALRSERVQTERVGSIEATDIYKDDAFIEIYRKYQEMFDESVEGIFQTTREGKFLRANRTLAGMLGYDSPEQMILAVTHIGLQHYVNPQERLDWQKLLDQDEEVIGAEHELYRRDGRRIWIKLNARAVRDKTRRLLYYEGSMQDIIAQKTAEAQRQEAESRFRASELKYRTLIESMSEGLIHVDHDDVIQYANARFCKMFGYSRDEAVGRVGYQLLIRPEDHELIRQKNRARRNGISDKYRVKAKHKSGKLLWIEIAGSPLFDAHGGVSGSIAVLTDITQRVKSEIDRKRLIHELENKHDHLQALSREMVTIQEQERRHIAHELHDEIGQILTSIKLKLESNLTSQGHKGSAESQEIISYMDDLIGKVRELSLELRPAILDHLGLLPAVLWHMKRFKTQTGLEIDFKHSQIANERFGSEIETATYRILQEGLTNAARHAGKCRITVTLWSTIDTLQLEIKDDGAGFEPAKLPDHEQFGISGMQERARLLGGSVVIQSAPGRGTTVGMQLPIQQNLFQDIPILVRT